MEEAAAQLALAESHVQSAPPARRRRLAVAIASLRLALARRSGQFSEVIEQVKLLDASIADESSDPIAMGSELRGVALLNLGIVETWSGRLARRRAAPLRGSRARPDDRPTLSGGRVSRASRLSVNAGLGRDGTRARPSGGSPGRALRLGRSADTRARTRRGRRHGDLDGRVRRGRALAAPRLGGRRRHTLTRPPQCFCTWRRACCTRLAGSINRRSKHSRRQRRRSRCSPGCTLSRRGSPAGSRPRRLASGCQTRRAQRSPDSPPNRSEANGCHLQRACSDLPCGRGPRHGVGCTPRGSGHHAPGRPRVHTR